MNDNSRNASFIRWQGLTIQQLGATNNLLTGLATGILAFECRFILDRVDLLRYQAIVLALSLFLLTCSVGLGLCTTWNRLLDFRWTARIARIRARKQSSLLMKPRATIKRIGRRTWRLFCGQTASFALGSLLPLAAIFLGPVFGRHLDSREYNVEGQIFRLNLDGQVQRVPGATVHVFSVPEGSYLAPGAEVDRLRSKMRKQDKSNLIGQITCSAVAAALQRQYANTTQKVDPRLLFDLSGSSVLEEWQHIKQRQDFVSLSQSRKRAVKEAFWLRRINEGSYIDGEYPNDLQRQQLWESVFDEEISAGTLPQKVDPHFLSDIAHLLAEEHQLEGTVEQTDPEGHFSLSLKRGDYVLIAEGDVPVRHFEGNRIDYREESAVWVKIVTVPRNGGVVMADPFCQPEY